MHRLLLYVFIFFLLGLIICHTSNSLVFGAALAALFLIFLYRKKKSLGIFCLVFLLLGFITALCNIEKLERKHSYLQQQNTFDGYIIKSENNMYLLKNFKKQYKIKFYNNSQTEINLGDYISFKGKVLELQPYMKNSLYSEGINCSVNCFNGTVEITSKDSIIMLPIRLREKINTAITSLNSPGGGFICGLVSGYTGGIDFETMSNFKELNLSHIIAVSGFNIGIIYLFLLILTNKLSRKARYFIITILLFFYTAFAGFEPSITRAFVMIIISIFAKLIIRIYDVLNGVIIAGMFMLILNSYNIYSIGFILSFTATLGIILFKSEVEERLPKSFIKYRSEIAISIGVFIITIPIILYLQGSFSILSIIVNIIIAPIISFITIFSFVCSLLFIFANINLVFIPCVFLGEICVNIIKLFNQINITLTLGSPSLSFIFIYYFYILISFNYIRIKKKTTLRNVKVVLLIIITLSFLFSSNRLKIHVLNVGQGDSILIESPNRNLILVDTGPEAFNYIATRDKIIPYVRRLGYNKLDMVILSHNHKDHSGGLNYLINNFKVNKIMVYEKPIDIKHDYIQLSKGDTLKTGELSLNILGPDEKKKLEDVNEASLILELQYKNFTMLFTGDAPSEELSEVHGNYDVFKVPHHGSINSLNMYFLKQNIISNAIISVGKNNFGHPSNKVIEAFANNNINVYRTDKYGDIVIEVTGSNYKIFHNQVK